MTLDDAMVGEAVERYRRERDRFQKLVDFVHQECAKLIRDDAIPATVQSRTKDPARLGEKLARRKDEFDGVENVFGPQGIKDLAGVRVVTYVERDRERVVSQIGARFAGPDDGQVEVITKDDDQGSFYRATHCVVLLTDDDVGAGFENVADTRCEIQICSLLAHVWNEIEHDLDYKPRTGELSSQERASLESLGNLTRAGDNIIETLLAATDARLAITQGTFKDQWDFVARARRAFPRARDFGTHSRQLYDELMALGYDTPERIHELAGDGGIDRAEVLLRDLQAHLDATQDTVVRQLDPESSDPLLMLLLDAHLDEVLARHPAGRGRGRPPRIASVARRVRELAEAS